MSDIPPPYIIFDKEMEDRLLPHDPDAPFDIGDIVFIKSINGNPDSIPGRVINKPQVVAKCWRVPLNEGEPALWDVTVHDEGTGEEFELIITHDDLTTTKPF